jgi:hypothetical protein
MESTEQDSESLVLLRAKIQEIDYYKSTVHEMANSMDKNIIEAYKWKVCAEELFKVLSEYHDHHGVPKDTILYRNTLDALVKYENFLLDT